MKNTFFLAAAGLLLSISACKKESVSSAASDSFREYTIPQGAHYANQSGYKPVELTEQRFVVKFDSSAIYQTASPENQYDINKLYGFSDNGAQHQQFSARFGWRWSDGALRLFGYTYNNGVRDEKELGVVAIGQEANCVIKVAGEVYAFTLNGKTTTMPRQSTTEKGKGYQLYPYFGGDEAAPHDVRIWIKE